MLKSLQSFFNGKKTYPEKTSMPAMLYIVVKGDDDPQTFQTLAMSSNAPIFFTKSEGGSTGRCGLPLVQFPPKDFATKFLLDSIADFLCLLNEKKIQYTVDSKNLCETDFKDLTKYLNSKTATTQQNDESSSERYFKMNNDSRSFFSEHHLDEYETTILEVIKVISCIHDPKFSNVKQDLLIKTYLQLKNVALTNPRLCYNLDEAISVSKLNFSDHHAISDYNDLAKLLLERIFVSTFFLEATTELLGDSPEYPHNTSKLDEKDLTHHVIVVCERGLVAYADSIELVEHQNKTLIKMVQSGNNMPRSMKTWRREIYFDVTGRDKNETLVWKIRAQVRIDDDKG